MNRLLTSLRRFLTAEEVPRWFGLSLVVIYFVGLMTVGQYALSATRSEATAGYLQQTSYAVKLLADRMASLERSEGQSPWPACGRVLKEFAVSVPVTAVRIVSGTDRKVLCSSHSGETDWPDQVAGEPVTGHAGLETYSLDSGSADETHLLVRAPIAARSVAASATPESLLVEALIPRSVPIVNQWVHRSVALAIVLLVLGALFLIYRCLREQLRSLSQIGGRLELHRDRLEHAISSLRIGDELDSVTKSWNQLVDMTESLLEASRERKANEELTRVLQRTGGGALADALHALPDALIHIVDETRIDYVNSAACRLLGWKVQESKRPLLSEASADGAGARVLELVRGCLLPEGRFDSRMELIEHGDSQGRDHSCYRLWVLPVSGTRHLGECLVLVRDVSQQIRAEKAREEFIAQVTHEFRTPLTNIRAYTETLSSGMFEDPQVISECYNVITKETRRLSRLIEDILSVSQLEVGSIELRTDNVDLRALLTEAVRDVRGLAEEKSIDVQLVLPAKLEPIRGDRDKLAVVLNNLLGNAIKYTQSSGHVVVGCQVSPESITLTVKDNGMGIAPADQAKVFEKFQRGTDPAVAAIPGTGIGLFTAREIVRRHGGDIELISEKGSGSTFLVRLPHRESRASAMTTVPTGATHGQDSDCRG